MASMLEVNLIFLLLLQVSQNDIETSLQAIPSNKATGLDTLPCVNLTNSLSHIIKPLTYII